MTLWRRTPLMDLLWTYARPLGKSILGLAALSLAANALLVLQPLLLAGLLAQIVGPLAGSAAGGASGGWFDLNHVGTRLIQWLGPIGKEPLAAVALLGGLLLAHAVLVAGLNYLAFVAASRIKIRSLQRLQTDLARHLLHVPLSFFHKARSGELLSRVTQDAANTAQGLGPLVQSLMHHSVQVVVYAAFLFTTNAWLTWGVLGVLLLQFGLNQVLKRPLRRLSKRTFDGMADLSTGLQETFLNIRVVKGVGAEGHQLGRLQRSINALAEAFFAKARVEKLEQPLRSVLDTVAILGILLIALLQLLAGRLTTEGFLLYLYVGRMMMAPVGHMATNVLWVQSLLASHERVHELLATPQQPAAGAVGQPGFEQRLELRGVTFSYGHRPVVDDVDLVINKGERVALVGPSGAGKSTLADLVVRFYEPDRGQILMDGLDVRQMDLAGYRRLFGIVPQETLLFHDSVADNIRLGRPIGEEAVRRAAGLAHADEFIERLPQGYDTVIGDRGVRLSGGQRQRLAIARAIAHEPPIIVFDEATSELDSESERALQQAIEAVIRRTTALIIAHRFSTILRADKIVVMDHGRIVDSGRHEELLGRCALYRHLCELQFGPSAAEPLPAPAA